MPDPASEHICGEGYGPGGVAVIITCAASAGRLPMELVRHAFREHGGRLGATGSVAYLFRPVGVLRFAMPSDQADVAGEAGAEEWFAAADGTADLYTAPEERESVGQRLEARGHRCLAHGSGWRAMHQLQLVPLERQRLERLVRDILAIEGVGHVFTNAQTTDQLLAPV